MQMATESQQNAPTFLTGFLQMTNKSSKNKFRQITGSSVRTKKNSICSVSSRESNSPILQIRIVLTDGWYCNKPPQNQPIYYEGVSRRNPKTKLQEERIEFHGQEYNAEGQNLQKSEWTKQRMPFIFIPPCRCELAEGSFYLK